MSFRCIVVFFLFFFFNDTATTEIYTLSLHDALPIYHPPAVLAARDVGLQAIFRNCQRYIGIGSWHVVDLHCQARRDRKSTRLNSSHLVISYAVFCLKKKTARRLTADLLHRLAPRTRT